MNVVDSSTIALCRTMMRDRRYSDVLLALQLLIALLMMSDPWCLFANGFSLATITITPRGCVSHPWMAVGAGGRIEEGNSRRRLFHRLPSLSTALLLGSSLDETGNNEISSEASPSEDIRKKEPSFKTSPSSSITTTSTSFLPKLIVTCAATDELVEAIDEFVKPHHRVAEIGSQLRKVSTQICQNCQHATLVDVQRNFPKAHRQCDDARRTGAMRLSPHEEDNELFFPDKSSFLEIAQLSEWPQALFSSQKDHPHERSYDILVLDVNAIVGNDLEWTSLQIIEQFHSYNSLLSSSSSQEDLIVLVKSSGLNQWALRINHPKYWQDHQDDLWNFLKLPPFIVATVGVQEYRSTIQTTVRPTDFVLEVGCHYGTTTALLQEHAAHCMGVDVGSKIIAQAKKRHAHVDFRVGDAWKTGELLRFLQDYKTTNGVVVESGDSGGAVDVIYVDVGGLSGSDGLLEAIQLISSLRYALEPRCIVIKSLCMQRLSTRLTCFWQLKRKKPKKLQEQS